MNNTDQTTQMLMLLLVGTVVVLFVLLIVYFVIRSKEKPKKENMEKNAKNKKENNNGKKLVFDFLEFNKIEDNMIINNNGKKYIMAIECQGVNYDLMSGVEKAGVEEGFVQFLNTLRNPIQIYIQTRTVNLEASINQYKTKVNKIETDLYRMKAQYQEMLDSDMYSEKDLNKAFFEMTKQTNLYEYGKDIIFDTEKMSLNKGILNKKYYIIISYFSSELGNNEFDKDEIQAMSFSELYTRAQTIIRAISACGVNGKILNSVELSELLYVAYNRDESETIDLKKALKAEYDNLYSTAPDVMEKRMKEINKEIERRAVDIAKEKVEKFKNKRVVDERESSIQDLADEMAQIILEQNRKYIGDDIIDSAIEELKKGGTAKDEKKKKQTRRITSTK